MLKRLFIFVAAVLMGVGVAASPVQAAINGCPESGGYFCLYNNINHGGGRWQVSSAVSNTCINLTGSSYTTGGTVYDSSASLQVTAGPTGTRWLVYAWTGCSVMGGWRYYHGNVDGTTSNLDWNSTGLPAGETWYRNIASVKRCTILIDCPSGVF